MLHASELREDTALDAREVTALKAAFRQNRAAIEGLTCQMRQAVISPSRDQPVVSEAEVAYLAPDTLLIDYEGEAFVLIERTRLTQLIPGEDEVEVSSLDPDQPAMETMLRELFNGRIDQLPGGYDERIYGLPDAYRVVLTLEPGEDPHLPTMIEVELATDSLDVRHVALTFPQGYGMRFEFRAYDKSVVPDAAYLEPFRQRHE